MKSWILRPTSVVASVRSTSIIRLALCATLLASLGPRIEAQGLFEVLPIVPGVNSNSVSAISGNGSIVVGTMNGPGGVAHGFRWTPSLGPNAYEFLASPQSGNRATDVSMDGSLIVGTSHPAFNADVPAIWSGSNSIELLPAPVAGWSTTSALSSGDGSFMAVSSSSLVVNDGPTYAFTWTRDAGFVRIGSAYSVVTPKDVSSVGNVVVGEAGFPFGPNDAFRLTPGGGFELLSTSTDTFRNSSANATNSDGSMIVGSYFPNARGVASFRWSQATGMIPFDDLGGTGIMVSPNAMSADGSIIAGRAAFNLEGAAAIWDPVHGTRRLSDVLAARGIDLGGFYLSDVVGISADGTKLVGVGYATSGGGQQQGWYVDLAVPEPGAAALTAVVGLAVVTVRRRWTAFRN